MKSNKTKESSMIAGIQPSIPEEFEDNYRLIKKEVCEKCFLSIRCHISKQQSGVPSCKNAKMSVHLKVILHNININITQM